MELFPNGTRVLREGGQSEFKIIGYLPNRNRYILESVTTEEWPKDTQTLTWPADKTVLKDPS